MIEVYTRMAIDSIQTTKKIITDSLIKDSNTKSTVDKLIDAETAFWNKVVDSTTSFNNHVKSQLAGVLAVFNDKQNTSSHTETKGN